MVQGKDTININMEPTLFPGGSITPLANHSLNNVMLSKDYQRVVYEMSLTGDRNDPGNMYIVTHPDKYAVISYLVSCALRLPSNKKLIARIPKGESKELYVRFAPGDMQKLMFSEHNEYEPHPWAISSCTALACGKGRFMNVYHSRGHEGVPEVLEGVSDFPFTHLLDLLRYVDRDGIRYYMTVGRHQECIVNSLHKRIHEGLTRTNASVFKNYAMATQIGKYFFKHVALPYLEHGSH